MHVGQLLCQHPVSATPPHSQHSQLFTSCFTFTRANEQQWRPFCLSRKWNHLHALGTSAVALTLWTSSHCCKLLKYDWKTSVLRQGRQNYRHLQRISFGSCMHNYNKTGRYVTVILKIKGWHSCCTIRTSRLDIGCRFTFTVTHRDLASPRWPRKIDWLNKRQVQNNGPRDYMYTLSCSR